MCVCVTCGYMDGCICLSSELVDPDFPVLWEEMAASASGRLSSSSWLLATPKIREAALHCFFSELSAENVFPGRQSGVMSDDGVYSQAELSDQPFPASATGVGFGLQPLRREALPM